MDGNPNEVVKRLKEQIDRLPKQGNHNPINISINLGVNGWVAGVGIAAVALLTLMLFEDRQIIREHTYQINAIYVMYPHLKPKEKP